MCVCVFSCIHLFVTLSPAPPTLHPEVQPARLLSVHGFSRQEYWSGLPFPTPGDLPQPGILPVSPALTGRFFTTAPPARRFHSASVPGARECQVGAETWHQDERRRVILCQIWRPICDHILTRLFTNGENRHKVASFSLNTLYLFFKAVVNFRT